MQEVNWGNFSAKFNGKEQGSFQWFCYLLFCQEFKQSLGIARYANHAGIETDPIKVDDDYIGWQAKYFDTPLSQHTQEFIDAINTAKKNHPELTKIIFYTNKDFGQSKKGTEPSGKTAIEDHAKTKGVAVEWRTASYFESPFVAQENYQIAKHFFGLDKSTFDLITELRQHTENLLGLIQADIQLGNNVIKLDRSKITLDLVKELSSATPMIISGEAGVGKTAVIKDLYEMVQSATPVFVFKATEFNNITNVNELVKQYGDFTLLDFVAAYGDITEKCIVIDSAEKLSDLADQTVFQEFLRLLLENNWKIIFTTRRSYVDDLKYLLVNIYRISFSSIDIANIPLTELEDIGKTHGITLPGDQRTKDLICNPFYLNEYIQNQAEIARDISAGDFKNALWDKQISKTSSRKDNIHIRRSECFIELAKKRANQGSFFIKSDGLDVNALSELVNDEIIGYDDKLLGYFIAHDIYEEWALEKIIEASFQQFSDPADFYQDIGSTLPIRRAFRAWLTNRLVSDKESVKALIEKTIRNNQIDAHWQDEALVSVLLSDKTSDFTSFLEDNLLKNDGALLVKVTFLLRIACKEIDEATLRLLGVQTNEHSLTTLFTKPKGGGWDLIIAFINTHKSDIGLKHMNSILPVIKDWVAKNRSGKTTKSATQIALFYYEQIAGNGGFGYGRESQQLQKDVIDSILNGAIEVKDELAGIADEVLATKQTGHRDKYHDLVEAMLSSSYNTVAVAQAIPVKLLQLADLFWSKDPDEDSYSPRLGVEGSFGITENRRDYFPSSALQTPVYMLLRFAPKETIDFILSFTNKSVEAYAQSALSENEIDEVEVYIKDNPPIKQYISARLWETYRGTHVSTSILESIHMALEKWLLEQAKASSSAALEALCLYLIKNSRSASITAVVVSVVLANPQKLFNVAVVLFKTKEFFLYDTTRLLKDQSQKGNLTMLQNQYPSSDYEQELHQNERIKACDDSHRKHSLENQALFYQWLRIDDEPEDQVRQRQDEMWKTWDDYYGQLPSENQQTDADKTWRLYLSRMDSRKMKLKTEKQEGQTLISFEPEVDPKLKTYSNDALQKSRDAMEHSDLMIWAMAKWRSEAKDTEYPQYANKPAAVLDEVKKIIKDLKDGTPSVRDFIDRATPAYACASLIRDDMGSLSEGDRKYCKDILLEYALLPLDEEYDYQYGDGVDAAINVLPLLIGIEEDSDAAIKIALFLTLFNTSGAGEYLHNHAAMAILHRLWKTDPQSAHSMFIGYLMLAPRWEELRVSVRQKNIDKKVYRTTGQQIIETLASHHEPDIERVITNKVNYSELNNIDKYDIHILEVAFELLPYQTQDPDHKQFLDTVLPVFSEKLLKDDRDDRVDYTTSHRFLDKFTNFVLTSPQDAITRYLKPFVDNFNDSRNTGDLFQQFISVQDKVSRYDEFWIVWNVFYDSIVKLATDPRHKGYAKSVIASYLFATNSWKEDAREWHTFQDREKQFFEKVARDMGSHPATLYAIAKLLKGIGSNFAEDGIAWISNILANNENLQSEDLEVNTTYYLENIVRRFVLGNRQKIRASQSLKKQLLAILDFLINKGSVVAYLTREEIL